jgi:hypothetical protein
MTDLGKVSATFFAFVVLGALTACGLYTPDKDPFTSDAPIGPDFNETTQGSYESGLVGHITCEISAALAQTANQYNIPWLYKDWGTAVTLSMTVEDQTGLSPGVSFIKPLPNVVFPFATGGNVTSAQSFSASIGGTGSVNALRTETIQYTIKNKDAIRYADCGNKGSGVLIDGDLKIREFVFDKAQIVTSGSGLWDVKNPPYNTWTEEITFVASYGGTATPTWHLARISANTSSNLVTAQRTNTNDLVITLGPLDPCQQKQPPPAAPPPHGAPPPGGLPPAAQPGCPPGVATGPLELSAAAMNQHNTRVQASAIATSVTGQTH